MAESDHQVVEIARNRADYMNLSRILWQSQNIQAYRFTAVVVTGVAVGTLHEWLSDLPWVQKHIFYDYGAFYWGAMLGLIYILMRFVFSILGRNISYVSANQNFMRPRRLEADATGIHETTDVSSGFLSWKGVTKILRTKDYLLFYVDSMQAHVIPVRNFPSREKADAFYKNVRALWMAANGPASGC